MSYIDDDEDLFAYDPEEHKESKSSSDEASSLFGDVASTNKTNDDIEQLNLNSSNVKLASAYHAATNQFVADSSRESLAKALSITLDTLTNGDFSKICTFYDTEMRIARRMIFLKISENVFLEEGTAKVKFSDGNVILPEEDFIKTMSEILNVKFTTFYIKTCYLSTLNISRHVLSLDRAMYLKLSEIIQIPVVQELFGDYRTSDEIDTVSIEKYRTNLTNRLADELEQKGIAESLSEIFGKPVKIAKK